MYLIVEPERVILSWATQSNELGNSERRVGQLVTTRMGSQKKEMITPPFLHEKSAVFYGKKQRFS